MPGILWSYKIEALKAFLPERKGSRVPASEREGINTVCDGCFTWGDEHDQQGAQFRGSHASYHPSDCEPT